MDLAYGPANGVRVECKARENACPTTKHILWPHQRHVSDHEKSSSQATVLTKKMDSSAKTKR